MPKESILSRIKNFLFKKIDEETKSEKSEKSDAYQNISSRIENTIHVSLSDRGLTEFPLEIVELYKLKILNLRNNSIQSIPKEISKLKNLEVLYLDGNNLNKLPPEIFNLENLKILNLDKNNITHLPENIGSARQLKRLFISDNKLSALPQSIEKLQNLEQLICQNNFIQIFPEGVAKLESLIYLNFVNNRIEGIDSDLSKMLKLESLNFGFNKIEKIPPSIGNLRALKVLSLFDNSILYLPIELNQLKSLEHLNLSFNRLQKISIDTNSMKELFELHLFGNEDLVFVNLDINSLCKRESPYSSKSNMIIDISQKIQLENIKHKINFKNIGLVDLKNGRIPKMHSKQIPELLLKKYDLKDPFLEDHEKIMLQSRNNKNNMTYAELSKMVPKISKFDFYTIETVDGTIAQLIGESRDRFLPNFNTIEQNNRIAKRAKLCEILTSVEFTIDNYGLLNYFAEYNGVEQLKLLKDLLSTEFLHKETLEYIERCLTFYDENIEEINQLDEYYDNEEELIDRLEHKIDFPNPLNESVRLLDKEIKKNPNAFCYDENGNSLDPDFTGCLTKHYINGRVSHEYNIQNGRAHGLGIEYSRSGLKERELLFANGRRVKVVRRWDTSGNKI